MFDVRACIQSERKAYKYRELDDNFDFFMNLHNVNVYCIMYIYTDFL